MASQVKNQLTSGCNLDINYCFPFPNSPDTHYCKVFLYSKKSILHSWIDEGNRKVCIRNLWNSSSSIIDWESAPKTYQTSIIKHDKAQ